MSKQFNDIEYDLIKSKTVGIAGCGGLGSNVAMNLARMSFLNLVLVDFDFIEESNLNRQFYFKDQVGMVKCDTLKNNLHRINPNLNIITHFVKIDPNNINTLFTNCDFVVEALDTIQSKKMFIDNIDKDKKIVCGSGLGNKFKVENIKTHKLNDSFTLIGDLSSDTDKGVYPISPGVHIVAAKQAAQILEYTIGGLYV